MGRHCGSRWREDGLAEGVLEEVAKTWKKLYSDKIVEDGDDLKAVLKSLEGCMSGGRVIQAKSGLSRQSSFALGIGADDTNALAGRPTLNTETSFGISGLEVEDEEQDEDVSKDPRDWINVVDAFTQPRLEYNVNKKNFERTTTKASLFPPPSAKTDLFRQRYHLVHQRILRNEQFQPPTFATQSATSAFNNKITAIANLLGRSGSSHLLLGLLTVLPTGQLALADLTGAIILDLQHARDLPADASFFNPGMIILVDGVYEEEYGEAGATSIGGDGGVGGTIGGKFIASVVGHPPCERRSATLGLRDLDRIGADAGKTAATGPGFGWTDFLGLGSERAIGTRMRRLETRSLGPGAPHAGNGKVAIAAECRLDVPATLSALRTMLRSYAELDKAEYPMAIVLIGNFAVHAAMSGAPGTDLRSYATGFETLAAMLAEFSELIAHTTLVLVPGEDDPWPSAFSAGAASPVPRKGVPETFRSKIESAVKAVNREVGGRGKRKEGCVEWCSNPGRLTWFNGTGEMVLWRDDVLGRMRRTSVRFKGAQEDQEREDSPMAEAPELEPTADEDAPMDDVLGRAAPSAKLADPALDPDTITARRLTKTLLDQAHLAPFPLDKRPVHWAYASSLHLYPLPTSLVVADSEAPAFALNYMGCCVMNPGCIVEGRRGDKARWVEYDVVRKKATVRTEDNDSRR